MPGGDQRGPVGFDLFSFCKHTLEVDCSGVDFCGLTEDVKAVRHTSTPPSGGPALALRLMHVPLVEKGGARLTPFDAGDEVALAELQELRSLEPLTWRYQRATSSSRAVLPTNGPRAGVKHRHWRARVVASDGQGGFEEYWCLLSSAASAKDRTPEVVRAACEDAVAAAGYAKAFNAQVAQLQSDQDGGDHDAESVAGIRVCVPVGCMVLGGHARHVGLPRQAVSIAMYPFSRVSKFVFEGREDYVELPQAFFHYAAWHSSGRETLADLQGFEEDDGSIILVDPVVLRPEAVTVGDFLSAIAPAGLKSGSDDQQDARTTEQLRFDTWHPRCGPLCKAFDPQRRSAHCRRHCGLGVPTCSLAGG